MRGEFKQSLADFDEQIRLAPDSAPGHWQRGISCYYAGEYAAGAKQFAAYHSKVDDNDVENSIWRSMCMTRASSLEKARADMLVVKHDGRVAMMEAYQMFAGKLEPAAVLKAAETDASPEQLNQQRFYANLYVGLFYDITGHPDLAQFAFANRGKPSDRSLYVGSRPCAPRPNRQTAVTYDSIAISRRIRDGGP